MTVLKVSFIAIFLSSTSVAFKPPWDACRLVPSAMPDVGVRHCWSNYTSTAHFCLEPNAAAGWGANTVLRARVSGPVVRKVMFKPPTWTAKVNLPRGAYSLTIDMRFFSFDPEAYAHATPARNNLVETYSFSVPSALCPPTVSTIPGSWILPDGKNGWLPSSVQFDKQYDLSNKLQGLVYAPDNCRFHTKEALLDCVAGTSPWKSPLNFCIYGDSQGRHLANSLEEYLQNSSAFQTGNTLTDKTLVASNRVTFFTGADENAMGRWALAPLQTVVDVCPATTSVVLLNFGQWQAGWPGKGDWPVSRYEATVRKVLSNAVQRFAGKRLVWLTTHPHGDNAPMYASPPTEWRSDVLLQLYNEASVRVCREMGVEFVDVFRVADVVHDLSYDGAHYKWPVEREIVKTVLHSLCV